MTPTLHMSVLKLALVQFITSGAMNSTVPQIEIGIESDLIRLKSRARPKSMMKMLSFVVSLPPIKKLSGLMSR